MRMGRPVCWPRSQKWPCFSYPSSRNNAACDALDSDNDAFVADGLCAASRGGLSPGRACSTGASCDRGVCNGGLCSALCDQNADCPQGMACQVSSFSLDDTAVGGVAAICVADLSLPPLVYG